MRLLYGLLIAGVTCLGFTVGCTKPAPPPENMQKDIQKGQAVGESRIHVAKPGYITKQDEGKSPAKEADKK
jgi:hypothetical protein